MLGFAKSHPKIAAGSTVLPVLRGKVLLAEHDARLSHIRSLVGVPEQHWRFLYRPMFAAFAETVQQLPAHHGVEAGGQLHYALEVVELALKIRRGYVLPPDKAPELVVAEQDLWTYAVTAAAVLHNVGRVLVSRRVMLRSRDHRPIGPWRPWLGPMTRTGATHYWTEPSRDLEDDIHQALPPLLACRVVPEDGLRWLGAQRDVLAAWLGAISHHTFGNAVIADIIAQAEDIAARRLWPDAPRQLAMPGVDAWSEKDTAQPPSAVPVGKDLVDEAQPVEPQQRLPAAVETGVTESPIEDREATQGGNPDAQQIVDPAAAFISWLVEGIRSGALALNTPKARVHVVNEGLLLLSPAVFRAFAGDDWRTVQKRFLKQKLTEKAAKGDNFFHYRMDTERGKKPLKGMLIRNAETKLSLTLPAINQQIQRKGDAP
ncbi:MAG TPA: TraI domain-containing protein [Woeseiaceae bacterium]|nr:TraI domain-containing protein [Woeseiaceae bacterium]